MELLAREKEALAGRREEVTREQVCWWWWCDDVAGDVDVDGDDDVGGDDDDDVGGSGQLGRKKGCLCDQPLRILLLTEHQVFIFVF